MAIKPTTIQDSILIDWRDVHSIFEVLRLVLSVIYLQFAIVFGKIYVFALCVKKVELKFYFFA